METKDYDKKIIKFWINRFWHNCTYTCYRLSCMDTYPPLGQRTVKYYHRNMLSYLLYESGYRQQASDIADLILPDIQTQKGHTLDCGYVLYLIKLIGFSKVKCAGICKMWKQQRTLFDLYCKGSQDIGALSDEIAETEHIYPNLGLEKIDTPESTTSEVQKEMTKEDAMAKWDLVTKDKFITQMDKATKYSKQLTYNV